MGLKDSIQFESQIFKKDHLRSSLEHFESLVDETLLCLKASSKESCYEILSQKINSDFYIYRPVPAKTEQGYASKKTYFTSYYTPDLDGTYEQTAEYKYPIYSLPQSQDQKYSV